MPIPPPSRPVPYARFTIVELILVMAVMSLILAITLPSLRGVMQANNVDVGSSMIAQEVRLARQHAIASGKFVAVLLPTAENNDEGGFSDLDYKASAFRTCYLTGEPLLDGSSSWYEGTFDGYVEDTSWSFLPTGVFIGYTEAFGPFTTTVTTTTITVVGNAFSINNATLPPGSCNVVSGIRFPKQTSVDGVDNVRSLIFRPDGSVLPAPSHGPNSPLNTLIVVQSAELRNGNKLVLTGDLGRNMVGFDVNRFTGKLQFRN